MGLAKFFTTKQSGRAWPNRFKRRQPRPPRRRLLLEPLEQRLLLSADVSAIPLWVPQGPAPIIDGQTAGLTNPHNPVAGAVTAIAVDPNHPATIYAGTANGGIWKTTEGGLTNPTHHWQPLTDEFVSLSIGAIAVGPVDSNTIYAGFGNRSSFASVGGPLAGLLKSTDAGQHWSLVNSSTLNGVDITTVLPTKINNGNVVLVAGDQGLFRSQDGGQSFSRVEGDLPAGSVSDIAADPSVANSMGFYAALPGKGVFRSTDGGEHWTDVTNGLPGTAQSLRILLAVHDNGTAYAALVANIATEKGMKPGLQGVFKSLNQGANWALLGVTPAVNPGGQGDKHLSMAVDPLNANILYLAGDRQPKPGNPDYTGNVVKWDGTQWIPIVLADNPATPVVEGTAPHADSRDMVFAGGHLLEADDGGIYLYDPIVSFWSSLDGDIQPTEFYSVAMDPAATMTNRIIGGAQDVGVALQEVQGGSEWRDIAKGDGSIVLTAIVGGNPVYDYSNPKLGSFTRFTDTNKNGQIDAGETTALGLQVAGSALSTVDNTIPFVPLYTLNAADPTGMRMLIGTNFLYESTDGGKTLTPLGGLDPTGTIPVNPVGAVTALAYGGKSGGVANPDVLYVGAGGKLWVRETELGMPAQRASYPGSPIRDIVLDPDDWHTAYILDTQNQVWRTTDAGTTAGGWTQLTGNLGAFKILTRGLQSIEVAKKDGRTVVLAGGPDGVFRAIDPDANSVWTEFGRGLPNALVTDLHYYPDRHVLLAGTFGRGAWTISDANMTTPGVVQVTNDDDPLLPNLAITLRRNAQNPLLLDIFVNPIAAGTSPSPAASTATPTLSVALSTVQKILVNGGLHDNKVFIDVAKGDIDVPVEFTGGGNNAKETINAPSLLHRIWDGFVDGLKAVGSWIAGLFSSGDAAKPLPIIDNSVGGIFARPLPGVGKVGLGEGDIPLSFDELDNPLQLSGIEAIFDNGFVHRLSEYLDVDLAPTPEKFIELLKGINTVVGDISVSIDPSTVGFTQDSSQLKFNLDLQLAATKRGIPLDLGANAQGLGLSLDASATVDATASVNLDFSFGLDLTAGLAPSEAFFMQVNNLAASVAVHATDLSLAGKVGFLGVQIGDGTANSKIDLSAGFNVAFHDPDMDGRITTAELTGTSLGTLVSVTPIGTLMATLPVRATLGSFSPSGSPTITVTDTNLFDAIPPDVSVNADFDQLLNFKNLTPGDIVGLLNQLGASLQSVSSGLNVQGIPLIGTGLSQVLDYTTLLARKTSQLYDIVLGASSPVHADLSAAAHFELSLISPNGDSHGAVTIPDNNDTTIDALVADINTAINSTMLNGKVQARNDSGQISLKAIDPNVNAIQISISSATDPATTDLGFHNGQTSGRVFKFDSIQTLIPELQALTTGLSDLNLQYDPTTRLLSFKLQFSDTFSKTVQLDLSQGINLGPLGELDLTGAGSAMIDATAALNLTVGVDLTPVGAGFSMTPSTPLSSLNGGKGVPIPTDGKADLHFALRDGTGFDVNLDGATMVDDVIKDINTAPGNTTPPSGPKLTARIDDTSKDDRATGIAFTLVDGSTPDGTHTFAIASLNGSLAGARLGILGSDINNTGKIEGTPLHGDSLFKHFFVNAMGSDVHADATISAIGINLTAAIGNLEIGVRNGSLNFTVGSAVALKDPDAATDTSGRITLDELISKTITASTPLSSLNSGRGVLIPSDGKPDLHFALRDGTSFDVNLDGATTVGDVLMDITAASSSMLTARIDAASQGDRATGVALTLVDTSVPDGTHTFATTSLNGSLAGAGLGILGSDVNNTGKIEGTPLSGPFAALSTPTISASGMATLPLVFPNVDMLGITVPASPEPLDLTIGPGNPITITPTAKGLEDLLDLFSSFKNFSLDNILQFVQQAASLLQSSDLHLLNDPIPLINKSVNQLLAFAQDIFDAPGELSSQIAGLKTTLMQAINGSSDPNMIDGLQKVIENTDLLQKLKDPQKANLLAAVEDLEDTVQALPDVITPATFTVPGKLVSAIGALANAIMDITTPPDLSGAALTNFNTHFDELKNLFAPIKTAVPSAQQVVTFIFDTLGLNKLITSGDLTTLKTTVLGNFQTAINDVNASGLTDPLKSQFLNALQTAHDDLNSATNSSITDPLELDPVALLKAFGEVKKAVGDFATNATILADAKGSDAISQLTAAFTQFSASFPGRLHFNFDANHNLDVGLDFDVSATKSVNLDFESFKIGNMPPLPVQISDPGSSFTVDVGAHLSLGFGLGLGSETPSLFLFPTSDTSFPTKLELTAKIEATNLDVKLSIGGVSAVELGPNGILKVTADPNDPMNHDPADLTISLVDPDSDGKIELSELVSSLQPSAAGGLKLDFPVQVLSTTLTDHLSASLDLSDFSSFSFSLPNPDDLINALTGGPLDLEQIVNGLDTFLHLLAQGLQSKIIGGLPIVGNTLDMAGSKLESFLDFVDTDLKPKIDGILSLTDPMMVQSKLQGFLFDILGPPGLNLLLVLDKAHGGDTTKIDAGDVDVVVSGTDLKTDPNAKVEVHLAIGKGETGDPDTSMDLIKAPFDLGFNGLGLVGFQTTGAVDVALNYAIDLGFSLDKLQGFSLLLNSDPNTPELSFGVDVHLEPNTMINANLFFIDISATDHGGLTGFDGTVGVNLSHADDEVPILDIGSLNIEPKLTLDAIVDLDLRGSLLIPGVNAADLPSIRAELKVDWKFSSSRLDGSSAPDVHLDDVTLDLGHFISKAIGPILQDVDKFLKPLRPVLDLLNQDIPVISQLSQLVGGPEITFLTAVSLLGSGDDTVTQVLGILDAIEGFVSQATGLSGDVTLDFGSLDIGQDLRSPTPIQIDLDGTTNTNTLNKLFNTFDDALSHLSGGGASTANTLLTNINSRNSGGLGITFDLLENPSNIFKLLLGQTANLITWDIPHLGAEFQFSQLFGPILPPIPLFARISGSLDIFADLSIGLDTRGLKTGNFLDGFFFGDFDPGTHKERPELGLNATFSAGAELNVVVASAGVEGGIATSVRADWHDPDNDGKVYLDELLANAARGLECIFDLSGALKAFFDAYVKIGFDTPFGFVTLFSQTFTLASVTLLDFSMSCPPLPPPVLAHVSTGTGEDMGIDPGTLVLNIGRFAGDRQHGYSTDGDETITVLAEDTNHNGVLDPGEDLNGNGVLDPNLVEVKGFGEVKFYTINPAKGIYADAGAGKDVITIDQSVTAPATLFGGPGDDQIQGGSGKDVIHGDGGYMPGKAEDTYNDTLSGGAGNDMIFGDAGDDVIYGNAGSDTIDGGAGNDQLYGDAPGGMDASGDIIIGGAGNDNIFGSRGNDTIVGDSGNDNIKGGFGNDTIYGGDQNLNIVTTDADWIEGGPGSDTIYGDGGDDIIFGEGPDVKPGQGGNDLIFGGGGKDTIMDDQVMDDRGNEIHGGPGDDAITTGPGNDLIFGDAGNDTITSGSGNDTIFGGLGDDVITAASMPSEQDRIEGGAGSDTITAGDGADIIIGGASSIGIGAPIGAFSAHFPGLEGGVDESDSIQAGGGDDIVLGDNGAVVAVTPVSVSLIGGAGNDTIDGGTGNDLIYGQGGDDLLQGGPGNDSLFGGLGNDMMLGQEGNDWMEGGAGSDTLFGGAGDDTLIGGASVDATLTPVGLGPGLEGGTDNNVLIGGQSLGDFLVGESGNDLILGDNGTVDPITGNIVTTAEGGAGNDTIYGGVGNDTIFGGGQGDLLIGDAATGTGNDLIVGDQGSRTVTGSTIVILARTSAVVGSGGDDTIFGSGGDDTVLGGDGNDSIDGGTGNDILVGDNGQIDFGLDDDGITTKITRLFTTDTTEASGGADTIEGQEDRDVILGGVNNGGTDKLYGDRAAPTITTITTDSDDIILGDNGELVFNLDADLDTLDRIRSYRDGLGGGDQISGNAGSDVLLGGTNGDTMYGDDANVSAGALDGEDIMLGDNGDISLLGTSGRLLVQVVGMRQSSAVDLITTTDTAENTGGADTMSGNAKADIILGGVNDGGQDTLYGDRAVPSATTMANDDDDILLGDNGLLDFTFGADTDRNTLDLIRSFQDGLGGTDVISGNKGADVAIGGSAGDIIYGDDANASAAANDGADILLGDNADIFLVVKGAANGGDLKLVLGSTVKTIRTTDNNYPSPVSGGSDTISGNAKGDIIAGGVEGDTLYGDRAVPNATIVANEGNDIILGDNGALEWLSNGRLSEITGIDIGANNPALQAKYGTAVADTDLTTLDLITTEQPKNGGRDTIFGDEGNDIVFGGTDADTIRGDDGDEVKFNLPNSPFINRDVLFGDHGRLYPQFSTLPNFPSRNFFAIDIGANQGGEGDRMWGEEGDDILLGQQGDDRMFGGSGDDDMIGGHNVSGGWDELGPLGAVKAAIGLIGGNDQMDGGSGNDAMAGDNALIWRRGDDKNPRFRALATGKTATYTTTIDTMTANVETFANPFDGESDPNDAVGRDIALLDHSFDVQSNPLGRFGNDVMAGGAGNDTIFGELGNDLMQGDGSLGIVADPGPNTRTLVTTDSGAPNTGGTLYFNVPEAATDGDDYMEGNGGNDLIYGGLGQDDIIGGSSALFGLTTAQMRPDGSDTIFGGAGIRTIRNDIGDAIIDLTTGVITTNPGGHARDTDYIMGDNANVFRLVQGSASGTNPTDPKDQFRVFAYDNYAGGLRIIPRAMQQLDYTLGGADYAGGTYINGARKPVSGDADNGAADLIHGESGDDIIFGMTGSDVIFGDGQDDDIVGGYGNDWISGGTGQDGVNGDDGLVYTSRNGTAELLYNIAATTQQTISTPGQIQYAVINTTGDLKKTIELVPFSYDRSWNATDDEFPNNADNTPFADDIIFGGLGSDFLHSGSGDDAISGAEALNHAYVPVYDANGTPTSVLDLGYAVVGVPSQVNPGDVLAFNPLDLDGRHLNNRFRAGEFALYDEYDPLRKILLTVTGELSKTGTGLEFLLNFDQTEGVFRAGGITPGNQNQTVTYPAVHDDGNDAIFGDNGNDWLVGGTGRDDMYGGWGNDLINADDDHTTHGGLNDQPDTHPTYEDRAYGGAGRDVLIDNTGGDRLIDWVGEYNTYLVPYAPFGEASVSRTLQPQLQEFLYALSKADGADQTQARDTGADPLRNGEPAGEMGLVLQKDFAWQDQTGPPSDPQAGNIPGGKRDVLRSADFNNGQAQGFLPDSGTWTVTGGRYQVAPTVSGGDAVSIFYVDSFIPSYFEATATINAVKPTGGTNANAYVVFDYQSPTNFKFAGLNVSTNKLEIGRRTTQGWIVDKQSAFPSTIKSDTDYNLFLAFNGSSVSMTVNNQVTLSFTFAPRVDIYGIAHGLNDGMVGLGTRNAKAQIDNVMVQRVAPVTTLNQTVDFSSGTTSLFVAPLSGTWTLANGRYDGTAGASTPAIDLLSFNVQSSSLIDLLATLKTTGQGGFVFDLYAVDDFKFVALSTATKQIILGHRTSKGWFTEAVFNNTSLTSGVDYTLGLTLKGTTVSVTLSGQTVLSYVYNALVTDGDFGLLSRSGVTSFDTVTVKSDDPAFASTGTPAPLLAAAAPVQPVTHATSLEADQLAPILAEAERRWVQSGLIDPQALPLFGTIHLQIADLQGLTLGLADEATQTMTLDTDAAGYGWFIDLTPAEDSEFRLQGPTGDELATPSSPAFGLMDLLTTVMHELGHVLGFEHDDRTAVGVMEETLVSGVRRLVVDRQTANTTQLQEVTTSLAGGGTPSGPTNGKPHDSVTAADGHDTQSVVAPPNAPLPAALVFDATTGTLHNSSEAFSTTSAQREAPEAPPSSVRIAWDSAATVAIPVQQESTTPNTWRSRVQRLFWRNASAEEATLATGEGQTSGFATVETSQPAPRMIDWGQTSAENKGKALRKKTAPSLLPGWFQDFVLQLEREDAAQGGPGAAANATKAAVRTAPLR